MSNYSVATIDNPEFIHINSISPLISKCEIKVLYIGENRNRSYISKEVATEMAQSLPGTPIVGYYSESKEDFGDHGQQMIIDGDGIKFNTLTTPYGFVAPDTKVWFQKFEETDDFGNKVIREYLMTEGYLWTGQFEECQRVLDYGNGQSMELDEATLKGHWSEDVNRGVSFFIINDAIFSKLCILGEDVEPCFEGANVTAPDISSHFSKDSNFNNTLFTMMQELKTALEGRQENMPGIDEIKVEETPVVEENFTAVDNVNEVETTESETITEETPVIEESPVEPVVEESTEFVKKDEEEEEKSEEKSDDEEKDSEPEEKDDDDDKKKYALLEQKYEELETKFAAMSAEYESLKAFKADVENKEKDNLINSFSMLTEEEVKEVVDNKANYSLDEIESKLSVIYTRKQRAAEVAEEPVVEETPAAVTYTLIDSTDALPDWVKAVCENEEN